MRTLAEALKLRSIDHRKTSWMERVDHIDMSLSYGYRFRGKGSKPDWINKIEARTTWEPGFYIIKGLSDIYAGYHVKEENGEFHFLCNTSGSKWSDEIIDAFKNAGCKIINDVNPTSIINKKDAVWSILPVQSNNQKVYQGTSYPQVIYDEPAYFNPTEQQKEMLKYWSTFDSISYEQLPITKPVVEKKLMPLKILRMKGKFYVGRPKVEKPIKEEQWELIHEYEHQESAQAYLAASNDTINRLGAQDLWSNANSLTVMRNNLIGLLHDRIQTTLDEVKAALQMAAENPESSQELIQLALKEYEKSVGEK